MHRFKMSCKDQREHVLDSLLCYCNVHLHHRNVFEIKLQDTQLDMIIRYDLIFKGTPVASENASEREDLLNTAVSQQGNTGKHDICSK